MRIDRPVIVVGAPRSGTTLLFSILSSHPELWSFYRESGSLIVEKFLSPAHVGWHRGNALEAADASDELIRQLRDEYYRRALNYQVLAPNSYLSVHLERSREQVVRKIHQVLIAPLFRPRQIRIVDKSPKSCLRIPFLEVVFPDAFFLFLTREPRANISSLLEGWRQKGRYETYHLPREMEIEGYEGKAWKFLLPPGWEAYICGARLAEICAFQYQAANHQALASLAHIPADRKVTIRYEELVEQPQATTQQICRQLGLEYRGGLAQMAEAMPPVNTATRPTDDKWEKNRDEILSVLEGIRPVSEALGYQL